MLDFVLCLESSFADGETERMNRHGPVRERDPEVTRSSEPVGFSQPPTRSVRVER